MRKFESSAFALAGVVVAGLTFGSPASAPAATHVVHPGESIQAAVDTASPGDTVVVKPGTHTETRDHPHQRAHPQGPGQRHTRTPTLLLERMLLPRQ